MKRFKHSSPNTIEPKTNNQPDSSCENKETSLELHNRTPLTCHYVRTQHAALKRCSTLTNPDCLLIVRSRVGRFPALFLNAGLATATEASHPLLEAIEVDVEHRRDVEGQQLRKNQTTDYGQAERTSRLRAGAKAQRDRQCAH